MQKNQIIKSAIALILILTFGVVGWLRSTTVEHPVFWGSTMGTSYSVTLTGKIKSEAYTALAKQIEVELAEINRQMSTWDPESEISRFNRSTNISPFSCSDAFASVVHRALELSQNTAGAFDPTLQPLLNLWGFGSEGEEDRVPSTEEIRWVKAQTGWQKIELNDSSALTKKNPNVQLALGAIAKGYGVDALARILNEAGYENWFIEIGGEVIVKGKNPDGVPWRIGIQYPTSNPMEESRLQGIVNLTHNAVATSGDYRNYIEEDGVIYSHILDPRSGRAVLSETASVTVIAPTCMDADGIATALFVMGAETGLAWVEQQPQVESMFLIRSQEGELFEKFSSGFQRTTRYIQSD
jgi:thiamine biosynthesis lipoprotein